MGPWDFAAGLLAPVTGIIDQGWYTPQEKARDALGADAIRAQEAIALKQAEALTASARYGALATETRTKGITTAALVGGAALVATAAIFALLR